MKRAQVLSVVFVATLAFSAVTAQAVMTLGDFRTESDLPDYSDDGPLVYEAKGVAIGAGEELDNSDFVENPSSWGGGVVHMDLDPATGILTLDSQDTWDFQTFDAWITNITFSSGESIIGVTRLTNGLTDIELVPTVSFNDNSIHISYDSRPGSNEFNFTGGTATFRITTSATAAAVPAPGAILLGAIGTGLVGWMRKRKSL